MKRRLKAGMKYVIMLGVTAFCLTACAATESTQSESLEKFETVSEVVEEETASKESEPEETAVKESEPDETDVKESEPKETVEQDIVDTENQIEYDVENVLSQTEETAAALEKKLKEDASLKQVDMNELSYEIYMVWDNTLNELWQVLKENLDEEVMKGLLEEQRAWITEKEEEVKQVGETVSGGSIAPLVCNQRAAELTKDRVYELAVYLGYVETE